jgi:hypothetical protein
MLGNALDAEQFFANGIEVIPRGRPDAHAVFADREKSKDATTDAVSLRSRDDPTGITLTEGGRHRQGRKIPWQRIDLMVRDYLEDSMPPRLRALQKMIYPEKRHSL